MSKSKPSFRLAAALLASFGFAFVVSTPSRAEIHCAGGHCNCSGDKDCNEMFEHHCAPTGASCNNDTNTCVGTEAKPVSSGSSGGTIKKHPVGTAGANKMKQGN